MVGLGSYKSEFDIINCLQFQLEDYNLDAKKGFSQNLIYVLAKAFKTLIFKMGFSPFLLIFL